MWSMLLCYAKVIDVSSIESETVVVGEGGAGGSTTGDGANGLNSLFGNPAHCWATGGDGGVRGEHNYINQGTAGGQGFGGTIDVGGGNGGNGQGDASTGRRKGGDGSRTGIESTTLFAGTTTPPELTKVARLNHDQTAGTASLDPAQGARVFAMLATGASTASLQRQIRAGVAPAAWAWSRRSVARAALESSWSRNMHDWILERSQSGQCCVGVSGAARGALGHGGTCCGTFAGLAGAEGNTGGWVRTRREEVGR